MDRTTGPAAPSNVPPVRATILFVAFTRWDPLRDLLALQERMERLSGHEGERPSLTSQRDPVTGLPIR